jgi:lipoyl(octanoyl) transferase
MAAPGAPAIVPFMEAEAAVHERGSAGEVRGREGRASGPPPITAHWLGRIAYRDAWHLQQRLAAARAAGGIGDQLLLLEHPPVLTLGRHADEAHVLASAGLLSERGIEVLRVERGGEVTYHGPGQLVAYPIVRLADRELLLRPYVRALEAALAGTCAALGVVAGRRDGHPGCWVDSEGPFPRKIGALGVRVERGVAYHGVALNITVDLAEFDLINPCGMPGLRSTSIARELGRPAEPPTTASVAEAAARFAPLLAARLGGTLAGRPASDADPALQRAALERLLAGGAG